VLTLITPTGDRPEAFALCEYLMSRQTCKEDRQWIVVDDGKTPTVPVLGQDYIRRTPHRSDPSHTLATNLAVALPRIKGDRIVIIEDDDYYCRTYLETMLQNLQKADLCGERGAKYYHIQSRRWYFWSDHQHASLCRTGFTRKALKAFEGTLSSLPRGDWKVDMAFWKRFRGARNLRDSTTRGRASCVGVKELPGRAGITHKPNRRSRDDSNLSKFKEWLGEDWSLYHRFVDDSPVSNIVIYTCSFGGYDKINTAVPGVRCVVVTDNPNLKVPRGWELRVVPVSEQASTPKQASRYWKMMSHELFPNRPTLYVDGNVRLKKNPVDLLRQILYQSQGSPEIILLKHNRSRTVRDELETVVRIGFADSSVGNLSVVQESLDNPVAWGGFIYRRPSSGTEAFNRIWWDLFSKGVQRDQLVLVTALDRSGVVYTISGQPIPFYGETSPWMDVVSHRLQRSKV